MNIVDLTKPGCRDISDAWFQLLFKILDEGSVFTIDKGSYAGQKRLEFDYVTIKINYPGTLPLLPQIPEQYGIPNPVADDYLDEYLPYLMTGEKAEGESYTYGQRIVNYPISKSIYNFKNKNNILIEDYLNNKNELKKLKIVRIESTGKIMDGTYEQTEYLNQIELAIWTYKNKGYRNNQIILQVAHPNDMLLQDPACLRHIDTRIQNNKLHFFVYFRSWDLWCLSSDTQMLTKDGWKNINDILETDSVGSIDLLKDEMVFEKVLGVNKSFYEGDMYNINTKRIDQLITPNHKILHKYVTHSGSKRKIKNWKYTDAKDLIPKDGSFIPLCRPYRGGKNSIGVSMSSLIGWTLTDGSFRKKCDTVEIYQSEVKIKYVNEIRELLKTLNINYNEVCRIRKYPKLINGNLVKKYGDYNFYTFTIPVAVGKFIKKIIPNRKPTRKLLNLNLEEREALFITMIKGDGSIKKGRNNTISYSFYQKDINTLEWFMELCVLLGKHPTINRKKQCVQISNKTDSMIKRNNFDGTELIKSNYKGNVWCVATKLKNIIIKRNDKISITGNSGLPANLAGIEMLKQYMAAEIGVESGEIIAASKGLHLYDYSFNMAKCLSMKDNIQLKGE